MLPVSGSRHGEDIKRDASMIEIYLCEDEKIQLLKFQKMIGQYLLKKRMDARIISARMNPEHILEDVQEHGSEQAVFFIDVELKGCSMNGFELAKKLKKLNRKYYFVFLTSHEELAYKVFEYELGVLDYIVKNPKYFLTDKISDPLMKRLDSIFEKVGKLSEKEEKETLVFECGSRLIEIALADIIYIQAVKGKHQVEVYTTDQMMNVRQTLKSIYEMLNDNFIYINKSCIIQKNMIREIDKKSRIATLKGGFELEIAIREMKNVCGSL